MSQAAETSEESACALSVLVTVISRPVSDRRVIDAGRRIAGEGRGQQW